MDFELVFEPPMPPVGPVGHALNAKPLVHRDVAGRRQLSPLYNQLFEFSTFQCAYPRFVLCRLLFVLCVSYPRLKHLGFPAHDSNSSIPGFSIAVRCCAFRRRVPRFSAIPLPFRAKCCHVLRCRAFALPCHALLFHCESTQFGVLPCVAIP